MVFITIIKNMKGYWENLRKMQMIYGNYFIIIIIITIIIIIVIQGYIEWSCGFFNKILFPTGLMTSIKFLVTGNFSGKPLTYSFYYVLKGVLYFTNCPYKFYPSLPEK